MEDTVAEVRSSCFQRLQHHVRVKCVQHEAHGPAAQKSISAVAALPLPIR